MSIHSLTKTPGLYCFALLYFTYPPSTFLVSSSLCASLRRLFPPLGYHVATFACTCTPHNLKPTNSTEDVNRAAGYTTGLIENVLTYRINYKLYYYKVLIPHSHNVPACNSYSGPLRSRVQAWRMTPDNPLRRKKAGRFQVTNYYYRVLPSFPRLSV